MAPGAQEDEAIRYVTYALSCSNSSSSYLSHPSSDINVRKGVRGGVLYEKSCYLMPCVFDSSLTCVFNSLTCVFNSFTCVFNSLNCANVFTV